MNEETVNTLNQNGAVTPEGVPAAPAPEAAPAVEAQPAQPAVEAPVAPAPEPAPVEAAPAPVAPAPEVAPAPVAQPVAPVAPAPEAQPVTELAPAPAEVIPTNQPVTELAPAPVAPAPEVASAPVAQPVAPVAPAPEAAPVAQPVAPVAQPVEAQAAVAPVAPVQPQVVAQPAGSIPVIGPAQVGEPSVKKNSNLGFILVVIVLVLAIVGLVVAFVLNQKKPNTNSNLKEQNTVEEKKDEPVPEPPQKEEEKPIKVSDASTVDVGDYQLGLPNGYMLYLIKEQVTVLVDKTNKVEVQLDVISNASLSDANNQVETIKTTLANNGLTVLDAKTGEINGKDWLVISFNDSQGSGIYGVTDIGGQDALEIMSFSYADKTYEAIIGDFTNSINSASKTGTRFAEAEPVFHYDKVKNFDKTLIEE